MCTDNLGPDPKNDTPEQVLNHIINYWGGFVECVDNDYDWGIRCLFCRALEPHFVHQSVTLHATADDIIHDDECPLIRYGMVTNPNKAERDAARIKRAEQKKRADANERRKQQKQARREQYEKLKVEFEK